MYKGSNKYFSETDIQKANKNLKIYIYVRHHLPANENPNHNEIQLHTHADGYDEKKGQVTSENKEKLKPTYIAGRNVQ